MAADFVAGRRFDLDRREWCRVSTRALLLLELRGVDASGLVQRTVEQKRDLMLVNADARISCVICAADAELTALFGVL